MGTEKRVKCKKQLWTGFHPTSCSRWATRDGFCGSHHPEAERLRKEKIQARYNHEQAVRRWYVAKDRLRDAVVKKACDAFEAAALSMPWEFDLGRVLGEAVAAYIEHVKKGPPTT